MVPVLQQLQVFLQTILIGIVVGMVIDLYRTVRRQGRPGPWITVAGDLFLWIFLAILVFFLVASGQLGSGAGLYLPRYDPGSLGIFSLFQFLVFALLLSIL
ncbi:MAG: spore cortex biosynthesis protein YabQ [Bacillota bacterium]